MKYLVSLKLRLGEYEKANCTIVHAKNEKEAGILALEGECHNEPDFSDFPEMNAVWDGMEYVYEVRSIQLLSDEDYLILKKYI